METVDDFAQDLRKLYSRAYSTVTYANPEAEKVGQMVLANQFISGLWPEFQAKVVGYGCLGAKGAIRRSKGQGAGSCKSTSPMEICYDD